MKRRWITIALAAVCIAAHARVADARTIRLRVGESQTFETPFAVERVTLQGDPSVGVEQVNGGIRLTAQDVGRAVLLLQDAAGSGRTQWQVIVRPEGVTPEAVRAFLKDEMGDPIPTLFCSEVPGSDMIAISGVVREPFHLERIRLAMEHFEGQVFNLARADTAFYEQLVESIRRRIATPGIQVGFAGEQVFLTGLAYSETEKATVEAIARAIYPNVQSFINVRPMGVVDRSIEKPLIQLECQIIEIKIDNARHIGIDPGGLLPMTVTAGWGSERGGGGPSGFVSLDTAMLIQALIPQIENGDAKILFTQNLVCENGGQARFFAGGSFWIVTSVPGTGEVSSEEVEHGISMEFRPVVDAFENIGIDVNIEFSNMGPTVAGYPTLLKRYVRTSVNVRRGQTLTLGSLMGSEVRETIRRIPLLGSIPVIGELFRSERYLRGETEMVVLITPRVVVPDDEANAALRNRVQQRIQP